MHTFTILSIEKDEVIIAEVGEGFKLNMKRIAEKFNILMYKDANGCWHCLNYRNKEKVETILNFLIQEAK